MKKPILYIAAALMAISLAACTPTPEKQAETASAPAANAESKSGDTLVEGKVPGPEFDTISVYSINEDGSGLLQNMDSLEEMTNQGLVDKLIEYGVLEEGTTIISLDVKEDDASGVVNLSAIPNYDGDEFMERATLEALVNTYIENYELELVKLQVNGEDVTSDFLEADENGYSTYFEDYEEFQN
ncbi:MAG: GerMN domain-containing protein [Lachnospiraceae bacterium]